MLEDIPVHIIVSCAGGLIGFVFGFNAWKNQFCVAGSILSYVFTGDARGVKAVVFAGALSLLGSQLLFHFGIIDLDDTIYRSSSLHLFGTVFGGLLFGYGMTISSGCGAGSLARLGAGDLRAIIVLMFAAYFGYMTMRGLTGVPREYIENNFGLDLTELGIPTQGLDHILSHITQQPPAMVTWVLTGILVLAALVVCFRDDSFQKSPKHWISSIVVALCILAGWLATGVLGQDDFEATQIASLTFVAPLANTGQYFMTFTGSTIGFGIASVLGILGGSFCAAIATKSFHWQYVDGDKDFVNAMLGGAMMGIGGVFAFGCSIGNGLSGFATLSTGSFIAWAAILFGGYHGAQRVYRQIL